MDYKKITSEVIDLVKEAAAYIREERKNFKDDKIEVKGLHNFVTHADKKAEEILVNGLKKIFPQSGFITEEGTEKRRNEVYNWIIDPIDGTTNFIHGQPPYAISVALKENNEIVIGIVYEIVLHECFHTCKGDKAYLNGDAIKVSKAEKVKDGLVATGFPYTNYEKVDAFLKTFNHFMRNSHGVRRLGSAATDLAYVACGRFDVFYEYGLKPWDMAAGVLLVKNAGGQVKDFEDKDNYLFGGEIIASNGRLHEEFSAIIKKFMSSNS